jgi:hypothetical protein
MRLKMQSGSSLTPDKQVIHVIITNFVLLTSAKIILWYAGYYRVNYDTENWKKIIATLNDGKNFEMIVDINRAQIIDDSMALAKGKYLDYEIALGTTEYLAVETEYLPWNTALRAFSFMGDRLIDDTSDRARSFRVIITYFKIDKSHSYW